MPGKHFRSVFSLVLGLLCAGLITKSFGPSSAQAASSGLVPIADEAPSGEKVAQTFCAACHGADGNDANPQTPKLAGQNPSYLYAQLLAFWNGTRASPVMSGVVANLSEAQAHEVASFYSRQTPTSDKVSDPSQAETGARIYRSPLGRGMPACAACHGGDLGRQGGGMGGMMGGGMMGGMGGGMGPGMGMGMRSQYAASAPTLNGQHAAYTQQQMDAFADGSRPNQVMSPIASALTEKERAAVAEYLSTQH